MIAELLRVDHNREQQRKVGLDRPRVLAVKRVGSYGVMLCRNIAEDRQVVSLGEGSDELLVIQERSPQKREQILHPALRDIEQHGKVRHVPDFPLVAAVIELD